MKSNFLLLVGMVWFALSPHLFADHKLSMRHEVNLGNQEAFGTHIARTYTNEFVPLKNFDKRMASNLLVEEDHTQVVVTFSGNATASVEKFVYVRVLMNGTPMEPGPVAFAQGFEDGTRTFSFSAKVGKGLHTVEVEWKTDGLVASIRNAVLTIQQSDSHLFSKSFSSSFLPDRIDQNKWMDIPGTSIEFSTTKPALLLASFTGITHVENDQILIRPVINGLPSLFDPSSFILASDSLSQARGVQFGFNSWPGSGVISFQWRLASGNPDAVGFMHERQTTVGIYDPEANTSESVRPYFSSTEINSIHSGNSWQDIPGIQESVFLSENAQILARFSGDMGMSTDGDLEMRLTIDDEPVKDSTMLLKSTKAWEVRRYEFVAKRQNLKQENPLVTIKLQWRPKNDQKLFMRKRSFTVFTTPSEVPDFADYQEFGLLDRGIDPAFGLRKVVTILVDTGSVPDLPSADAIDNLMWNGSYDISSYFDANSLGRVKVQNEKTIGWIRLDKSFDYYWNNTPPENPCDQDFEFKGFHAERWAEVITKASQSFDFSKYDTNGDGWLDHQSELAILVINGLDNNNGAVRNMNIYCNGDIFQVDDVTIPIISEASFLNDTPDRWIIAAHELGHSLFELRDMYVKDHYYDAELLSLMGSPLANGITPHLDGVHKLALGWANPRVIKEGGVYRLTDVRQNGDLLILPRLKDSDSREYFVLENRQLKVQHSQFDEHVGSIAQHAGTAVWHAISNNEENIQAPVCINQDWWLANIESNNQRRGIRLLQPAANWIAWRTGFGPMLDQMPLCSDLTFSGAPDQGALIWADGTPSGFSIHNWSISKTTMTFEIFGGF